MTHSSTPTPGPASKAPRWMRIVLFVSLAFNLAVVGLVIGVISNGGPDGRRDRGGEGSVRTPYVSALEREDRRALGRELRRELQDTRGNRNAWAAQFATAIALLRADPFDAAAFAAHMDQQFSRNSERETEGRRLLGAFVAQMSNEDRAAYADRLEEVVARGPKKDKKRPKP